MRIIFIFLFMICSLHAKDYTKNKEVQAFIQILVKEYAMDKVYLEKLFSDLKENKTPLKIYRCNKDEFFCL